LPASFQSATLTDIILHGTGQFPAGVPFLAAATVAAGNTAVHSLTAADSLVISGATLKLAAGSTISGPLTIVDGGLDVDGATTQINGGPVFSEGTGAVFDVAQGATLDLTGGHTVNYRGSFTGTGAGALVLQSGEMAVGPGAAIFRFSPPLFQW